MNKFFKLLFILTLLLILTACGTETFRCGWCMKEVTQKPHTLTALGQEVKICESCYKAIDQYRVKLK